MSTNPQRRAPRGREPAPTGPADVRRESAAPAAVDRVRAPDRWEFGQEVTDVFENMLDRSIPQIETMRELVTSVASAFVRDGTLVLDLGCSRGDALASLTALDLFDHVTFLGLEVSDPMLTAARERFAGDDRVDVLRWDLRRGLDLLAADDASVVLSVLTLMFVPVNYRARLVRDCHRQLAPGGAMILVEKVLGEGPEIDDVFNANYHRKKVDSGYDPEEVARKRLSLEGVLVPFSPSVNEGMLRRAGFAEVDCFWRWCNFAAWVAIA